MSNRNGRRRGQRRGGGNAVEQYRPTTGATVGASRDKPWTFTWKGEVYRLPPAEPDTGAVTGGDIIDHVRGITDRSEAEMRLVVNTLYKANPDQRTEAALREMPLDTFSSTLMRWMQETSGAGPGESSSSST